ncbi:MAG: hypothetical protein LBT59_11465, partial [Clostridiales bacterium]|nr:hypothetical protein [Clostridiales bacterium]
MTSPNSSNKRRKLRRHASLSAFNLGLAGISVATLAIFIFLQQIQGGRLELVKAPSPQTSYYLAEYHQGYLILFAIIAMQAIVTATYSLRFIHGRRSSTTDQSPPVSRDRLFLSKYLAGLIAATVPFLAYMAILVIANVQAFGYSSQMAQAALLLAAAGFTAVFSVYSIASVVCLMAGTSAKGMAFSVFLMFGPYFILNSTTSIFKFFLHGNAFGAVNNYFGTTMPSLFDHVSPYLPGWGMIPFLEKYSYSTGTWGSRLGGAFILAAWILLSILASALALRLFKRDKAERAGVTGQAGCMGTLFCFTVAYAMFGLVFTMINTSGFDLLLYGTMAFIASFLVCKLILARDVEIAFKFKTLGQLLASAAITAAACVICATGLFGYASYQPNLDEIESASITYAGAPDFLIGESGEFGSYKYPDLDGDYLEWVFRDFSDLEYSSKSDLRTVLDIHKILIDEKPRLLGNSSDALTDQIHVTYRLANGGKVERQYKLIMPDASLELLRLDSTEAVKQRISETFATLLDAELSPFLVTDSLFQNELEPSHADAKRLLSAFLEDSSERTIESKYFPDKLCRAIISFPRISP